MWPTIDGLRVLRGQEAELVRHAIGQMRGCLVDELVQQRAARIYGIDWFDQWEVEQRIWLLEQIATSLFLEDQQPPPPAAIFEATVDAVFCHMMTSIEEELEGTNQPASEFSWRQGMINAFRCQHGKLPSIDVAETEIQRWFSLAAQVADTILGQPSYQQAERFRDRERSITERFLTQRALPEDYLQRIPPLRTDSETSSSLSMILQAISR